MKRDPRVDPKAGDVLLDDGLHIVVERRPSVSRVSYRASGCKVSMNLSLWRIIRKQATVVSAA
jgi:hypothetical protein